MSPVRKRRTKRREPATKRGWVTKMPTLHREEQTSPLAGGFRAGDRVCQPEGSVGTEGYRKNLVVWSTLIR